MIEGAFLLRNSLYVTKKLIIVILLLVHEIVVDAFLFCYLFSAN